jgi:hypothetical protein
MTDDAWAARVAAVEDARTVWTVQLAERWFADPAWARTRDDLDLGLFRALLRGGAATVRRLLLYDPPGDLGGAAPGARSELASPAAPARPTPPGYQRAKQEHERWLARVRRQLAALGAPSSAGHVGGEPDYLVRLVVLPRAGRPPTIDVPDGIWIDVPPPAPVRAAWDTPGLVLLDPHEENIIGPHSDRNPLWAGNVT